MPILNLSPQGRFGNICCQTLFARAIAEQTGADFRCDDWVGNRIFALNAPHYDGAPLKRVNEYGLLQWALLPRDKRPDIEFRGYAQLQECANAYTKRQAQQWLVVRPDFDRCAPAYDHVAHRRVGDYAGYGYPVVSKGSYLLAISLYGWDADEFYFCTEEDPIDAERFPWAPFLPDFMAMLNARVLLRGNSTFSWVAGLLSNGIVLSPVIEGKQGGMEHHCEFVVGNHPRLANFDFTTTLYVAP